MMSEEIPWLRRGGVPIGPGGGERDLSLPQVSVGKLGLGTEFNVSELLHAIPMVRAAASVASFSGAVPSLFVQTQPPSAMPTPSTTNSVYDSTTATVKDAVQALAAAVSYRVVRFGQRVKGPVLDATATKGAPNASFTGAELWIAACTLLRDLDIAIARGTGGEAPPSIAGLTQLAINNTASIASVGAATIEREVRQLIASVTVNQGGAGAGAHCLFGGALVLRKLMSLTTGQNGLSGFKLDPRTGLNVYHYAGLPFYRTRADESIITTCRLYAANLGPQGLNLVHTEASADSFGLVLRQTPVTAQTGLLEWTLTGGFALVTWEDGALWELKNMDCTTT